MPIKAVLSYPFSAPSLLANCFPWIIFKFFKNSKLTIEGVLEISRYPSISSTLPSAFSNSFKIFPAVMHKISFKILIQ